MNDKSFRDLDVWQESMSLAEQVYEVTGRFPGHQLYSLTQQAQRSAVSVPSNIAEGHGRKGSKEFMYHLRVARGSLSELETQMLLGQRLEYITEASMNDLHERIQKVGRLLNGLLRYLERASV
jgi:four helix bundle protein